MEFSDGSENMVEKMWFDRQRIQRIHGQIDNSSEIARRYIYDIDSWPERQ